uniref:ShKT domain-containing protein n=1 Tax=Alexandrium monilatum TaxID=311494 RepID=A0A7S4Q406_9DINO|mmetsp:Transcript_11482/g.36019  ORF Transcript_11482/g.36019 Transcript_11482/m.36019 type:complete len:502 (+) Transcript_11482:23-1528(+)
MSLPRHKRRHAPRAGWRSAAWALSSGILVQASAGEDRSPHCREWAAGGECRANAAYMLRHCARSCNATAQPAPGRPPPARRRATAAGAGGEAAALRTCLARRAAAAERCRRDREELERAHRERPEEAPPPQREGPGSGDRDDHEWQRAEAALDRARAAESQLRQCRSQAAADRVRLVEETANEVREELREAHAQEMERAAREAGKREWRQMETAKAAAWRAERAEARLAGVDSGADRRAAERMVSELTDEAAAAEQARWKLEEAHRQLMREASERERQLRDALEGAEARLRAMEQELEAAAGREQRLRGGVEAAAAAATAGLPAAGFRPQNCTVPLDACPASPPAPARSLQHRDCGVEPCGWWVADQLVPGPRHGQMRHRLELQEDLGVRRVPSFEGSSHGKVCWGPGRGDRRASAGTRLKHLEAAGRAAPAPLDSSHESQPQGGGGPTGPARGAPATGQMRPWPAVRAGLAGALRSLRHWSEALLVRAEPLRAGRAGLSG